MSEWKNGFCDCCGSMSDCLIGWCCPCIHAGMASKSAGQETLWWALQCFFYPLAVPILRNQVRESRGIDGSLLEDLALGWCW